MPQTPRTLGQTFIDEGWRDPIDLAHFIETHWDSDYWQSAWNFINENWTTELNALTAKQKKWAEKILDDCVERKLER